MDSLLAGFTTSTLEADLAADHDGRLRQALAEQLAQAADPLRHILSQGVDKADFQRWAAALDAIEAARRALPLLGPTEQP
ncbi:EscE/YscE/SsaE family type III secretion system needle protein co-chaperone [Chitinimonas lacunae]|uniref:EscE/YscE/SsaE family type III secretion system needle protein co-chaperone n=1 Tax=Chitinimonas lacunae TaxID=1963018 RepID=A0ABV8MPH9_9NEIS